jgi:pilus assembly protein FimV
LWKNRLMTLRSLRLSPRPALSATRLAVALMLGSLAAQPAWAARLGHSRVISAQDAPLQVLITISDLTRDERDSLQVSMANAAAWERAGLTPPVPLSTMTLRVEEGPDRSRKNVRLTSTEVARDQAVDLLFNLGSGAGQRQVQVTVMQSGKGFPGLVSQATVGTPGRTGQAGGGTVGVRQGDTLYGIAQSRAVADATIYQMLVALWQANPRAFIQNNMNLVKAGAALAIPDAATVRAIDPAQARRIFLEQQEAYARYRANLAAAAGRGAAAAGASATSGQVGGPTPPPQPEPTAQDRVRLSSGQPGQGSASEQAQARGDAETSTAKATRDTESRVGQLERNVKDLNAALAGSQEQAAAGTGTAASGAARNGSTDAGGMNASPGNGATAAQGSPSAAGAARQPGTGGQAGGAGISGAAGLSGTAGAAGSTATPDAPGAQGANGAAGAPGSAATSAAPGVSGDASTLGGSPGVAGAPGVTPNSSTGLSAGAGAAAPAGANGGSAAGSGSNAGSGIGGGANPAAPAAGSMGTPGGVAGNTGATTPGANSGANSGASAANGANGASTQGAAPSSSSKIDSSGLPAWLSDNLLIVLTIVLALIAFIIAWLLRRAGARRAEDAEDMDEDMYASEIDPGTIDRRLKGIDLDLDTPAGDSGRREPGTIRT